MTRFVLISMVKNESTILRRCLDSCVSLCEAFCFLDTGSADGTVDLIRDFLQHHDGCLHEEPFVDFGHSRTRSYQLCRKWVKETHPEWDLSDVYGLLLDADMVLQVMPTFQEFVPRAPCYQIIQINNYLEYPNTRLVRLSEEWECIGVTHEYWGGDSFHTESIPKSYIYIRDLNDGGCKSDKFIRDIRLLEEGLIKDKKNEVRYTFYLAQSYENIDKKRSIYNYKKRIHLGGWFEEVFVAWMRIGDMVEDPADKIHAYLEAFEVDGKRSESLYRLAKYYRIQGKNNIGLKIALWAKTLPYPTDRSLFLEKDVYEFKLDEEISICAYYSTDTNEKKAGFASCERNVLRRGVAKESRELAFQNEIFYIEILPCAKRTEWKIISPGFYPSSCSLLFTKTFSFTGCQRMVNYTISENGDYLYTGSVRTKNVLIQGDAMQIDKMREVNVLVPRKRTAHVQDLEDIRLVWWRDQLYALATTNEYGENDYPSQVLCHFNDEGDVDSIVQLDYAKDRVQKNWCPFVYNDRLCCIYDYHPFVVLEIQTDGTCTELIKMIQPYELDHFRGSSPPVRWGDHYYQVVHVVYFHKKRKYIHRIIEYDLSFHMTRISKPFYFEYQGIEYCLTLGCNGTNFYMHYSKDDNSSNLVEMPMDRVEWSNI